MGVNIFGDVSGSISFQAWLGTCHNMAVTTTWW